MKYKTKFKLKKFWYYVLAILTQLVIVTVGFINEKPLEVICSIVFFFIFSPLFNKQYHSKSFYKCSFVSVIVYFIITRVTLKFATSVLFTIVLTFIVTSISYFVRDLLDKTLLLNEYRKRLEKFEHKCIENLTESELQDNVPTVPYDIVHIVYGYLHKPKTLNATGYALKCNISEATLYRYLKKVKEEYEKT